MDPVKILKRAWYILWNYRALWVFGLILALATAGSSGGGSNSGSRYSFDSESQQMPLPEDFQKGVEEFTREMERLFREGPGQVDLPIAREELTILIWIAVIFTLVMIVLGIIVAIARYVSETAVIRMVDEYEGTDTKMTVRQGFRIGWSRTSWRLFLINLIAHSPFILWGLVVLSVVTGLLFANWNGNLSLTPFTVISMIGVFFLVSFMVIIVTIVMRLFRQFVWRVSTLEDVGVGESFNRGWALVRENWKSVGLMWLVMIGLGIVWAVASIILVIITLPLVFVSAAIVAIPALLLAGLFSMFLSNTLAWVLGILFILPLFLTMAFFPLLVLEGWQAVFTSSVWTLTYREIKAMPNGKEEVQELPAAS
jgi:hypothetical protein